MRARLGAFALACALTAVPAAGARPLVPSYDAAGLASACEAGLAAARKAFGAMEARRSAGTILSEWDRLHAAMEDVLNPAYLLASVHPDKAVREAAEPCLERYAAIGGELFQSAALYARLRGAQPANAHQAKLRKDLLEGFEDGGAALAGERGARAKEILERIEALRQEFDRTLRDDPTRVAFTAAEMEGLPEAYLRGRASHRNAEGGYALGLDDASYLPFMARARSAAARERYYLAHERQGGEENLARLAEIFALRRELAALHGLPTYAHYALRRTMAGTPASVEKFLAELKGALSGPEARELQELGEAKARDLGIAADGARLAPWEVAYYQQRVRRERFGAEPARLFPTDASIAFMLRVAERLFGLRLREAKVAAWHPQVRYFDVIDARSGRFVSGFYLDLFPREGKDGRAATFPIRGSSRIAARMPCAALVASLDRAGLAPEDLETLLHEFGHVLHDVLSQTESDSQSGTSVKVDFVEAPARLLEEWAWSEESLGLFGEVCPSCPRLAAGDLARRQAARRFGEAIRVGRQWRLARLDLDLSTDPRPPRELWARIEEDSPLGGSADSLFPASFSHIAGSYGAGYYGYLWSQALALDLFSAFEGHMLDGRVGERFRDAILSQGGQAEEIDMVRRFLGRESSAAAFLARIRGR